MRRKLLQCKAIQYTFTCIETIQRTSLYGLQLPEKKPLHFKKAADTLIKRLEASGVIVKVPANEKVEWC